MLRNTTLLLSICLFLNFGVLKGQDTPVHLTSVNNNSEKTGFQAIRSDLRLLFDDGKAIIQRPAHWSSGDWIKFAATASLTAALIMSDEPADDLVSRNPGYDKSFPVQLGKWTGEPLTTAVITGGLYIYGLAARDKEIRTIGFEVGESFLYSGMITGILKYSFGRWRPYKKEGAFRYSPFRLGSNDYLSLPSGHATLAFSLTTVLASHTDKTWLKILIYSPAVLTMASRVYHHQHWVSDVFMGAAIGYFTGSYITSRHKNSSAGGITVGGSMLPGVASETPLLFISVPL